MYNRGDYKNRVYFSHGDLTEGFMFMTYPKPIGENNSEDGVSSGWIKIKGKLVKEFSKTLTTGKCQPIQVTDEDGKKHTLSGPEVKMLRDQYIDHCLELLADTDGKRKLEIIKTIGLEKLAKVAGQR